MWPRDHPGAIEHGKCGGNSMIMPAESLQSIIEPVDPKCLARLVVFDQHVNKSPIEIGVWIGPFDELHLGHQVALVVQPHAAAWLMITPRPANFLIVGFDRARCFCVNQHANIRFVDSHSKRIGCEYHIGFTT